MDHGKKVLIAQVRSALLAGDDLGLVRTTYGMILSS
jgi:hypothetical protein